MLLSVALVGVFACGSRPEPDPPAASREVAIWHSLGKWAGSGNMQTSSFPSDTGSFRVEWETRNERTDGAGWFRLTLHSAISGRPLVEVTEQKGVGRDVTYVHEDPRVFYLAVDSANVDWSFSVEERVVGVPATPPSAREH